MTTPRTLLVARNQFGDQLVYRALLLLWTEVINSAVRGLSDPREPWELSATSTYPERVITTYVNRYSGEEIRQVSIGDLHEITLTPGGVNEEGVA